MPSVTGKGRQRGRARIHWRLRSGRARGRNRHLVATARRAVWSNAILAALLLTALVAAPAAGAATNTINTIAGTGVAGYNGDGIAAATAQLSVPIDVAPTADGGYLIADEGNDRIRKVSASGTISTVAGNGADGDGGNGVATALSLKHPLGVAPMPDGGFVIADYFAHKVRRVFPNGQMQTIAGTGVAGYNGDGINATTAQLNHPARAVPSADGGVLIVDQQNQGIRKVLPGGTITTVAGGNGAGFSGDGGQATAAQINNVQGIAVTADGGFLLADSSNHRIRKVAANGVITTIAGNGTQGSFGSGIAATDAQLNEPGDVAEAPNGEVVIADNFSHLIRVVGDDGKIRNLAGTPDSSGFSGDGGPATAAQFDLPWGIGVDAGGDVLVTDHLNNRIRRIDSDLVDEEPSPVDERPPVIKVGAKKTQPLAKKQPAVFVAPTCDEACSVVASGFLMFSKPKANAAAVAKSLRLKTRRAELAGGESRRLRLGISKAGAKKAGKALRRKRPVFAQVKVIADDAAGNRSTKRFSVRIVKPAG